nr:hypothetical protein [uncultured Clostridium sp.]
MTGKSLIVTKSSANEQGKWELIFPEQQEERNIEVIIWNDKQKVHINNVNIGEVWLAGGQSNMEYPIAFDEERFLVENSKLLQDIRFYNCPKVSFEGEEAIVDYSQYGKWRLCNKDNLMYYSAVAYYFANELHVSMDVPIGIIGCNWGGTPACAWIDSQYLRDMEGKVWLEEYKEGIKGIDIIRYKKILLKI